MTRAAHPATAETPVDVGILTVIPPELHAAIDALSLPLEARGKDDDGTVYWDGLVHSALKRRDYRIVLTCIGEAGNSNAAAAAAALLSRYKPRALFLMGIAAGIRHKVKIGDVVLSDRVVKYEPAALVNTGDGSLRVEHRPDIDRLPHGMMQDLANYRCDTERLEGIFRRIGGSFPQPRSAKDLDFEKHVATSLGARPATFASGEKLLRDPDKLYELRDLHGKVEVAEMEASGLVDACRRFGASWIVFRGISDFGDDFKDDRFHAFASKAAAAVLADFLAHGLDIGNAGTIPGADPKVVDESPLHVRHQANTDEVAQISPLSNNDSSSSGRMTRASRYWVFDWFDSHGIHSDEQLEKAIRTPHIVRSLSEIARGVTAPRPHLSNDLESVVAGRGIDLSGDLDCCHKISRAVHVDRLLRHVWHYFDRIVVADTITPQLIDYPEKRSKRSDAYLSARMQTLLYVKRIGAEDLLEFYQKQKPCTRHWRKHAADAGLASLLVDVDALIEALAREASFSFTSCAQGDSGHTHFDCTHPILEHMFCGTVKTPRLSTQSDMIHAAAEQVVGEYVAHLTSDFNAAQDLVTPLGSTVPLHHKMIHPATSTIDPARVAFDLDLPIVRGLPIEWLIKVRQDNRPSFDRYRQHLRMAIQEATAARGKANRRDLSLEIRRDVIDPELRRIRDVLVSTQIAFSKKAAVGAVMGTMATVCGLVSGASPQFAAAAGVGALLASLVRAAANLIDERQKVSLSPMYFLWQATRHHHADDHVQ